jgi:hypothetical protein
MRPTRIRLWMLVSGGNRTASQLQFGSLQRDRKLQESRIAIRIADILLESCHCVDVVYKLQLRDAVAVPQCSRLASWTVLPGWLASSPRLAS